MIRKPSGQFAKTHGLTRTPVWNAWKGMRDRCRYKYDKYHHGRGIIVCERWETFMNFYTDMGCPPAGYQLDRIEGNKNYEPSNCRWVTPTQNSNNKSNNKFRTYNGETRTLSNWARKAGLSPRTFAQRIRKGWSMEQALTIKLKGRRST